MPVYFVYLALFFGLPLLAMWLVWKKELIKYKKTIAWSLFFVYTVGWFWDWLSYKTGVWRYDSQDTFGVWISGIPLEEFIGFYLLGTLFIATVVLVIKKHV